MRGTTKRLGCGGQHLAVVLVGSWLLWSCAVVPDAPEGRPSNPGRTLISVTSPNERAAEGAHWALQLALAEAQLATGASDAQLRRHARWLAEGQSRAAVDPMVALRMELWMDGVAESRGLDVASERRLHRRQVDETPRPQRRIVRDGETAPVQERWALPVASPRVTSPYGPRIHPITGERGRMHHGIDYGAPTGTAAYASASGRVLLAGWCGAGPGNCVVIEHAGGWRSQYFHLATWDVRAGAQVQQGQRVGGIGATGSATGPHLHYQVGVNGQSVDPDRLWGRPVGSAPP